MTISHENQELCDIFSLDNHLSSLFAISGAAIFYGSHVDSFKFSLHCLLREGSQKYVLIALR